MTMGYLIIIGLLIMWLVIVQSISTDHKKVIDIFGSKKFKINCPFYIFEINSSGKVIIKMMACNAIKIDGKSTVPHIMLGTGEYAAIWYNANRCFLPKKKR